MATVTPQATEWQTRDEVGSSLGIRILLTLLRVAGRRPAQAVLSVVVFYYVIFQPSVRRHSREYLARAGAPTGFGSVYKHVFTFARCALDRFFFVAGRTEGFELRRVGMDTLASLAEQKRGAILLGAHFGSFEALRAGGKRTGARVNVVMDNRNAQRIRRFLHASSADGAVGILEVGDGGVDLVLRARDCIERGEFVAILADRVGEGQKAVRVPFLGGEVSLPAGPFLMASTLGCPVYLTLGAFRGGARYDLHCEPFAERIVLPRATRQEALAGYVQAYAARMESHCREAPYNWFNFFDYWGTT